MTSGLTNCAAMVMRSVHLRHTNASMSAVRGDESDTQSSPRDRGGFPERLPCSKAPPWVFLAERQFLHQHRMLGARRQIS